MAVSILPSQPCRPKGAGRGPPLHKQQLAQVWSQVEDGQVGLGWQAWEAGSELTRMALLQGGKGRL